MLLVGFENEQFNSNTRDEYFKIFGMKILPFCVLSRGTKVSSDDAADARNNEV